VSRGRPDVGDYRLMKSRLLAEKCGTCVLRHGDLVHLGPARLAAFLAEARENGYVVCHSTLPGVAPPGVKPAICRGFKDAYKTWELFLIERLWGFIEVPPPEVTWE
jgi:hypothetical protein